MADSDALRARRRRRHLAGDHSLCRHEGAGGDPAGAAARLAAAAAPDGLVAAVVALEEPRDAPGRALVELARLLAGRLVEASDGRAQAALAGRLRDVLVQLERRVAPAGVRRPNRLEQLRAARHGGPAGA